MNLRQQLPTDRRTIVEYYGVVSVGQQQILRKVVEPVLDLGHHILRPRRSSRWNNFSHPRSRKQGRQMNEGQDRKFTGEGIDLANPQAFLVRNTACADSIELFLVDAAEVRIIRLPWLPLASSMPQRKVTRRPRRCREAKAKLKGGSSSLLLSRSWAVGVSQEKEWVNEE